MEIPKVYISSMPSEASWHERLVGHLQVAVSKNILEVRGVTSHDGQPDIGRRIRDTIDESDIAVLLVSSRYLTSRFIIDVEMPYLMRRHAEGKLAVLPLIVSPVILSSVPELVGMRFLNEDTKSLAEFSVNEREDQLTEIAQKIADVADGFRQRSIERDAPKQQVRPKAQPRRTETKHPYFISHCRLDGDFAELLQRRLEKEGLTCWIDTDRLTPGVDWQKEIDDAVRQAPAIIAIMSPEARDSEYVTYEWAFAIGCGKPVIPLMLRQTPLHPRLAAIQFLDFSNRVSRPWSDLIKSMREHAK